MSILAARSPLGPTLLVFFGWVELPLFLAIAAKPVQESQSQSVAKERELDQLID